ncbi:MAG: VWA domain-containing protein [Phycisphaerales bacterium]|nr:MAG: VWA domain-containing protein [Phycisphaerales bacterium]
MNVKVVTAWVTVVTVLLSVTGPAFADEQPGRRHPTIVIPAPQQKPLVQMAILLDTSGSMSGLIDQARTELWAIVNEFIFAKRGGQAPELQVALYEYGKSSLSGETGFIRQIVPLTTDLDKISEELFALTTNGGQEYCGWVISEATKSLKWSDSPDDLKVIFIAGNEPFTQGRVDYREACKQAIAKGIIVNTIHCGSEGTGIDGKWKDGAVLADGKFLNIDHNRQVVHIEAPQDREIAELGIRLNDTYIAYGRRGKAASERQAAQDSNARAVSEASVVQRAVTKSSRNYRNEAWDLVDALKTDNIKLAEVEKEDLPENMQKMTPQERKAYVETQAKQRAEIQKKIQKLNELRKKYVAEEMKKRHGQSDTLGSAITNAIREQAKKKNLTFESPKDSSGETK